MSLGGPVPLGSPVSVVIERPGSPAVELQGEVVRVERVPGQAAPAYDVGVRFVKTARPRPAPPPPARPALGR